MGQILVRSKATGKTRLMTERNLDSNRDKFERVYDGELTVETLKYTSEKESEIKKKIARVAGANKTNKKDEPINGNSPE